MLDSIWNIFKSFSSTFITVVIFIALYILVRKILDRQSRGKSNFNIIKQIILFLLGFVGIVAIILALPMNETLRGQVTSLMGIVISAVFALSSATFIGNLLAGILLRAVNSFKHGDFIEVGDYFGRVTEKALFHTELQTIDRDLLTLPNLYLATNPVKVKRVSGTFITSSVSLGYDVSRNKIEKLLLEAASRAELTDAFVLVTSLGDFSVVYEIHGQLTEVKKIISSKSKLNQMILDVLHEAKIEIVSPTFMNQRQVNETVFIPKQIKIIEETTTNAPETVIFDKAESAEFIEQRRLKIDKLNEQIKALEQQLKDTKEESTKTEINTKIERCKELREKIFQNIENKQDQMND